MLKRLKIATAIASVAAAALVTGLASGGVSSQENTQIAIGASAPDFTRIDHWFNSPPLTLQQLKGKVVLVDFWTFDCINCVHTLPHVNTWHDKYRKDGLVVVGVHTPEFSFEHDVGRVADAVKRYGITWPVAQDNQYATWNAYGNQYWPALYLLDQKGKLVYSHYGEGGYDETEKQIRALLGLS